MKSVGEVMSIGSNFQESFQKALCSMEEELNGISSLAMDQEFASDEKIQSELTIPGPKRLFYVADAIRKGWTLEKIHNYTKIDFWFLDQIEELISLENELINAGIKNLDKDKIIQIKEKGFSDNRIAELVRVDEDEIRALRKEFNINPVYKRVDTCAAEFCDINLLCIQHMEESVKVIQLQRKKY